MTALARLPVFAGVLALGCWDARNLGVTLPTDAAADVLPEAAADRISVPTFDVPDLAYIEVDCTPSIAEVGRFSPQCQLTEAFFQGADSGTPGVICERIADAGGWVGSIHVYVRRPREIVIGQPMIIGGSDPNVSVSAASGSVVMELVQTVPDSAAGAVVFDAFEPGRLLRGRFVDVTFSRYPRPPTYPCRISSSEFVAQPGSLAN